MHDADADAGRLNSSTTPIRGLFLATFAAAIVRCSNAIADLAHAYVP